MKKILFMGDSITDAGRDRENRKHLGYGYATMVSGVLGAKEPYQYEFINRGISGNRVVDLFARTRMDMIVHRPDYMSILIGVNDVWHEYTRGNGVPVKKYETVYNMLIEELKAELPELKLMILEPFVLPGLATCNNEDHPTRWEYFAHETRLRAQAAARVAKKNGILFVPLQDMFDKANSDAPFDGYWLRDGVHPTAMGHELIKNAWLKAFEKIK